MTTYNNNSLLTDFKIILNSEDTTTWTGPSKYNAQYNLDLKTILNNDIYFDKAYKMTFQFQSTIGSDINYSKIYLASFLLNNGASQQGVYQPLGTPYQTTGILTVESDDTTSLTIGTQYSITNTTTGTNYITLNTTSGLTAFQQFVITGTTFGGLTAGTYYIQQIVNTTKIILVSSPPLLTATGFMLGAITYSTNKAFLRAVDTDNSPTYINNLRNVNKVNVKVSDQNYSIYGNIAVKYVCILHFTEIQGNEKNAKRT